MSQQPVQKSQMVTWVAAGLLLVSLVAPCALPNRIVAGCALCVGLLAIGSLLWNGYQALQQNRKALEEELRAMNARNPFQGEKN